MLSAYFITTPPLDKVKEMFAAATGGAAFVNGASWRSWTSPKVGSLDWLYAYYRPCHVRFLTDTICGTYTTPLVLLRQLLKTHNYFIDAVRAGEWRLRHGQPQKCVIVKEGVVVEY